MTQAVGNQLAERRLFSALAVINTAPKSVLIATDCLEQSVFRNCCELGQQYKKWADWPHHTGWFYSCCNGLLTKFGIAESNVSAEEGINAVQTAAWRITEQGKEFYAPIATWALHFSVQNNICLYNVFGSANTPTESQGPENSFNIIRAIRDGHSQIKEIADAVKTEDANVRRHLLRLRRAMLVVYDSISPDDDATRRERKWAQARSVLSEVTLSTAGEAVLLPFVSVLEDILDRDSLPGYVHDAAGKLTKEMTAAAVTAYRTVAPQNHRKSVRGKLPS